MSLLISLIDSRQSKINTSFMGCFASLPSSDLSVNNLLELVRPVSLPYTDIQGRTLQLWKLNNVLIASLEEKDVIHLLSGSRIYNALQPHEDGKILLDRLEHAGLRRWHLSHLEEKGLIAVWPFLEAAGRFDGKKSLFQTNIDNQKGHIKVKDRPPKGTFPEGSKEAQRQTRQYGELKAAWREARGEVVKLRQDGIPYNHREEVQNAQQGLKNTIFKIRQELSRNPSPEIRARLTRELSEASRLLDHSEGYVNSQPHRTPASRNFEARLQQTKLTDSFNATHKSNSVPAKGGTGGSIGGVACSTAYIEGLFESPESLFEDEHYFFLPRAAGGECVPFSDQELQQILRELAIGIYVHSTVPFFSLHFNQDSDLFPVIHPFYENTLVGRVIGMLDYIMKGYLNGGIFEEGFIDAWCRDPNWKSNSDSALKKLIDFKEYCESKLQGEDKSYVSLREFLHQVQSQIGHPEGAEGKIGQALEALGLMQQAEEEPEILKRFQGFSNSFRIIAKQNSIRKEGQVFVIDADFDVLYTINPSPAYQAALEIYQRKHGKLPPSYQIMQMAYELFCKRIHDHMVKLPLCREYFSMLAMINFFSSYFSTLKKHRKIPRLPSLEVEATKGCPSIFPHLPIRSYSQEKIVYLPLLHMKKMMNSHRSLMERYLVQQLKRHRNPSFTFSPDYNFHLQEEVLKPWAAIFKEVILESVSSTLRRILIKSDFKELNSLPSASLESMTNRLTGWLLENPSLNNQSEESVVYKFINDYIGRSYNFLEKAGAGFLAMHSSPQEASRIFDEVFKDKSLNQRIEIDTSGLLSVTSLKAEISPEELEEGKKVVGGCGVKLEKQKIEHSHEAADIWQNNWSLLQALKPEMWQRVSSDDARNSQGAIFRLGMEDVPPEVDNDYTWMESLLLIPQGLSPELLENRWKITRAIAADNVEAFSRLVKEVPGLKNMKDRNGRALLHEAALADNPFYLDTLLKMGLSCQEEDAQGYLPIHYAAMKGNLKHLEILLGYAPASLNAQSHSHATPLTVASQHQQTQAVRLLLSRKPKFLVSTEGYTPFHSALHEGHAETIRAFLDHPDLILPVLNMLAEEGGTPLMLACELDSQEFVQQLIKMGADPKIARKDGVTAMEISILRHCDPVLQCLLAHASPSDRTIESAAKEGSVKTIEILAQSPSFFAYRNAYQDTALHLMIRNGNMQAAIACIDKCADPSYLNVKNLGKETPFSMSASLGIWQLVDALYQKRAEIDISLLFKMEYHPLLKEILDARSISDSDLQYYLLIAAQAGNYLAITQVLEPKGAKLEKLQSSHGWQLLHYLAKADGIFLFRRLIRQAGDYLLPIKEEGGRTLAYIAAEYGSSRVLKFLLENLKKLHIPLHKHFKDRHLLYGVMESRCVNHCKLILEMFKEDQLESAELDLEGTRPVHLAARLGLLEIFHILDKSGVDFAVRDRHGFTSLDYATRAGAGKVVKFLLKKGGAVFITPRALFFAATQENKKVWKLLLKQYPSQDALNRALILAIENGDDEAFFVLLEGGASIDYVTEQGWTPLLMASRSGQSKILQEILKRKSSNKKEINGNGPLHLASKRGYTHCVGLLLKAGYRDVINGQGKTALDLASGHQGIQMLLKDPKHTPNPKIEAFAHAIQQGDTNAILEILEKLPPDEEIFLETQQMCGTPLQLLIRLGAKKSPIAYALKEFKGNPNLQDSEGNTLAHLLLMAGIFPLEIPNIDLSIANYRGQTPLHLAAQFAIPRVVERLLEKSDPSSLEIVDKKGWTSIYYAIEGNRAENVRFLCRKGANLKHAAYNLSTPLMLACQRGVLSIIRGLLEEGADPNQAGSLEGWVPLSLACEKKDNEMTLALLGAGAKLDKRADTGVRVIHLAAQRENHLLMRIFSAQGYSLKLKDDRGMQPIHYAASSGKADALKTIAALDQETVQSTFDLQEMDQPENKAMAAFKGATSLHFAARFGTSETVRTLLDLHSNPEAKTSAGISTLSLAAANEASISVLGQLYDYRFTQKTDELCKAIQSAIMNDQIDAVMSLYERGMLVSGDLEEGYSGLHFACQFNALQTTQWLLSQGADPFLSCSTGENAFEISAVHSGYEQFSLLLEYAQPDLDQMNGRGEALIHLVARAGKLHHMMLLILYGASINTKNIRGETPLHSAVKEGHLSIARLLIACGADMYVRTEQGKTPVDLVPTSPDQPIKKALLEFQRILQETNKHETLLHKAVRFQEPLAVMILTHFEKLDQPDCEGITPLQLAVQLGQMQSVINLLQRGAGVNVADKQGRTPLLVASVESPNPDLVKLLLKAGANPMVKDASGRTVFEQVQKMDFPKKTEVLEIFNKN